MHTTRPVALISIQYCWLYQGYWSDVSLGLLSVSTQLQYGSNNSLNSLIHLQSCTSYSTYRITESCYSTEYKVEYHSVQYAVYSTVSAVWETVLCYMWPHEVRETFITSTTILQPWGMWWPHQLYSLNLPH